MAKLLKEIYNNHYIELLANNLAVAQRNFPKEAFKKKIFDQKWAQRTLKQRMQHISIILGEFLPKEYEKAIKILKEAFSNMSTDYNLENMVFQDFVEVYGINNFDVSMEALEYFTIESSSEFAIRRFIIKYPEKTMEQLKKWAKNKNPHVRRLASEGSRPRLPWSTDIPYFKKNPKKVLELLDLLKDDESSYVRESVANSLNDISKDNPLIFKKTVKKWIGANTKRDVMLKKSSENLLKQGDKKILEIFGFHSIKVEINDFKLTKKLSLGDDFDFSFKLVANEPLGKLRVEYAISFVRKNEKYYRKTFKIYEGTLNTRKKFFQKKFSFKPIKIRKYYKGVHFIEIIINGKSVQKNSFLFS